MEKTKKKTPWDDMYDAMEYQVPRNEAERIAAQKLGEGLSCYESRICSGLTEEEFQSLLKRLNEWENENCNKPENWIKERTNAGD